MEIEYPNQAVGPFSTEEARLKGLTMRRVQQLVKLERKIEHLRETLPRDCLYYYGRDLEQMISKVVK